MKNIKFFSGGHGIISDSPSLLLILVHLIILAGCAQQQRPVAKEPVEMLNQEMQVKAWLVINHFIYEDPNFAKIVRKHTIMGTHDPHIPPNEYVINRLVKGL